MQRTIIVLILVHTGRCRGDLMRSILKQMVMVYRSRTMSVQQQNPGAQTRLSEFLSFLFVQAITLMVGLACIYLGKETSRLEIIGIILNLKNVYIVS